MNKEGNIGKKNRLMQYGVLVIALMMIVSSGVYATIFLKEPSGTTVGSSFSGLQYILTSDGDIYEPSWDNLKTAINGMSSGGTIFLPAYNFTVNYPINVTRGLKLVGTGGQDAQGTGDTTSFYLADGANCNILQYVGGNYIYFVSINNIYFNGNKNNNAFGNGTYFNEFVKDSDIYNCFYNQFNDSCIYIKQAWNNHIMFNTLEGSDFGIYVDGGADCKIAYNKMLYNDNGSYLRCSFSSFDNNYLYRNVYYGLQLVNGGYNSISSNSFQQNSYPNAWQGTDINMGGLGCDYNKIIGNSIDGGSKTTSCIKIQNISGNKGIGNIIIGNSVKNSVDKLIDDTGLYTNFSMNDGYPALTIPMVEPLYSTRLQEGMMYFNKTSGELCVYNNSAWVRIKLS